MDAQFNGLTFFCGADLNFLNLRAEGGLQSLDRIFFGVAHGLSLDCLGRGVSSFPSVRAQGLGEPRV